MSSVSKPSATVFGCSPRAPMACCPSSCKRPRAWACATLRLTSPAWKQCSSASPGEICVSNRRAGYAGAFLGLMLRDLRVLRREIGPFAVRIIMQPLLFLFVFTYVFPHMGQGNPMAAGGGNFGTILLPGLMAVAIMFSGIAAVALPLSQEFGITREIDDRVMCPLPVAAVAVEKICFSALQCMLAALLVVPLAYYVPATHHTTHVASWPFLIL